MSSINTSVKDLLDAGVHFGHQTRRWNPRSKPFVFDHRQGISIIDLGKTHARLEKAASFVTETVANGGTVLFVGTKRPAQEIMREAATSVNMPFCVDRWLGGTLTNFATVKRSMAKYKIYLSMETSGELQKLPGKEGASIKREMGRMARNFSGIIEMNDLPQAIFIIDVNHEKIAVAEGERCAIPTVGLVDTNSDPTHVAYPIPGNDDAVKSIRIIVDTILEAIQAGLGQRDSRRASKVADLKAVTAEVAAAAAAATTTAEGEAPVAVDAIVGEDEVGTEAVVAKKPLRKKIAAPKTEE